MATSLLTAKGLRLEYPTKQVFTDLDVAVEEGDRVGIVGQNGGGKSTLLRLLSGDLAPDAGQVTARGGVRVGVLGQRDDLSDTQTVGGAIVGARAEHEWAGDARIRGIITGLTSGIPFDAQVGDLSGGERRRVALAALLVEDWDILILDEPTNHLDIEAITWLAAHVKSRWPAGHGALLVVTHDRWFLDEVCLETWEVHDRMVEPFEGGYAAYILQRVERNRIAAATEAKRQNLMRKELAWLRRGAPARTSKPRFRIDAANQLIADVPPHRDSLALQRLAVSRLGKEVIDLEDVSVSYGDRTVLEDVTWRIGPGERTGILGANGAGKSTLLGLICGTLRPTTGKVKRGRTVSVGLLDQQFGDLAEISDDRVREILGRTKTTFTIDGKDFTPAQLLERLGFESAHLKARVGELSGGQKRRLQILLLLLSEPNVIVLDEPTNDVDHEMLTALEDLLDSWPGTLIVVSHDRYLLERVTDQQYAILDGKFRHVPGGVDEYLALAAATRTTGKATMSGKATSPLAAEEKSAAKASSAGGAQERALRKELSSIERRLDKQAKLIEKIHEKMAAHDQTDYVGLQELTDGLRAAESESEALEESWLELSEQLD